MTLFRQNSSAARLAVALAFCFLALVSEAQAKPKFGVAVGFAGFYRPGCWTPICILIDNASDSDGAKPYTLKGTLRVTCRPEEGDVTYFQRQIEITHQQTKLVTIYAKIPESRDCQIDFTRGFSTLFRAPLKDDLTALAPHEKLVVFATGQSYFSPRSALNLKGVRRAFVAPERLPDQWIGYEAVDLLVLPKDVTKELVFEGQKDAMTEWVQLGGRLLAIGGMNWQTYQNSFLAPILPAEPTGSAEIETPAAGGDPVKLLAATLRLKPGAIALWPKQGPPRVARWSVGRGEASFYGIDLEAQTGGAIPELGALWDSAVYSPGMPRRRSIADALVFGRVDFGYGRAARLPNVMLIILILTIYTVLVGPVNFYILGKRRRLELAWFTIPAIVVGFSVAIYLIGAATKGGSLMVREVDVVEAAAGAPAAKVEKLVSLFSPYKRPYSLSLPSEHSAVCAVWDWLPGKFSALTAQVGAPIPGGDLGSAIAGAGWPLSLDQTAGPMTVSERVVGQWSTQNFDGASSLDLGGAVEGEAAYSGKTLSVRVVNNTKFQLKEAVVAVGEQAAKLGDLPAGAKGAFEVSFAGPSAKLNTFGCEFGPLPAMLGQARRQYAAGGGLRTDRDESDDKAVGLYLSAKAFDNYRQPAEGLPSAPAIPLQPRLMAWIDTSPLPAKIDAKPDRYAYGGMVVVDLPVRLASGPFEVNPAQSITRLADLDLGETGEFSPRSNGVCAIDGCAAVFSCSPGFRAGGIAVRSLDLVLDINNGNKQEVAVSVYDFAAGRWTLVQSAQTWNGSHSFGGPLAPSCANPIDGAVFVRVAAKRSASWSFQEKDVEVVRLQARFAGVAL